MPQHFALVCGKECAYACGCWGILQLFHCFPLWAKHMEALGSGIGEEGAQLGSASGDGDR